MAFDIRSIAEFGGREPDLYWSRLPGRFVSATTGEVIFSTFDGTIQAWYETFRRLLHEQMPEATLLVVCPDTALIVEHSFSFAFLPTLYFDKRSMYIGKLDSMDVYKSYTIHEDRFIAVKLIDDAVHDMKVGKIV